ncbi:hypothetical protein B0H14DRAFT_3166404 [Mycena olivaceomarginata]|nr:hypothetical protein B0H14DRAFT_3166404 [Mycena olivaceomarginata]
MSERHPYLTLVHRISLTWLAYPIFALGFVTFNLQIVLSGVDADVQNAKTALLASCYGAQAASSASASLPRYMAMSVNRGYSIAVNDALTTAQAALNDSLTVVEAIIDFFVDTYRSTFLCFLQLVVQAGLAVLGAATAEATTFVESAANTIANSIDQSFSAAMSGIQSAISAANKVPGINIPAPSLTPPDLSSLQNLQLPSTFQDQLNNLSSPTLVELRQIVDNIIDAPFSALRDEINGTFASLVTDPSIFPIPGPVNLTFCDQFDTSTIDDLAHEIKVLAMWCTVVMILATVGMMGINCGWQIYRNHQLTECLKRIQRNLQIDAVPMDAQLLSMHSKISHPILSWISEKSHLGPSREWLLFYVFQPPAMSCLLMGVCGIVGIQVQILGLDRIHSDYSGKISMTVATISNVIFTSLNDSITSQSAEYASSLNSNIDGIQAAVNGGVFGWVNSTTTVLNETLAGAYSDIQNAMTSAFGGTILDSPIQNFIQCILGNKVDEIETALAFLHTNLVISIPRLNSSALLLSEDALNEGGSAVDPAGLVGALLNSYEESLRKEMLMYEIFAAMWLGVLLLGVGFIAWGGLKRVAWGRLKDREKDSPKEGWSKKIRRWGMLRV